MPNDEKLFSIFEPHTELLKRGKAGKDIEFGHMIQIQQVDGKFIADYDVFDERPVEYELLESVLKNHKKLFGRYPNELAGDKGYYDNMAAIDRLQKKVPMVSIAKKGRRTLEETEREHDLLFRIAQRFRAGVKERSPFSSERCAWLDASTKVGNTSSRPSAKRSLRTTCSSLRAANPL